MPLADGSADKIVCNMPWGRRVGSHRGNRRLYPKFLREAARVLRPGGRAVLLTQEKRLFSQVAASLPEFTRLGITKIVVGGLEPSIYLLERQ